MNDRISDKTCLVLKEMRGFKVECIEGLREDIKTLDAAIARYDAQGKVLIWSFQHDAWWRVAGHGYTRNREEAGAFDRGHAQTICEVANLLCDEGEPNEEIREQ